MSLQLTRWGGGCFWPVSSGQACCDLARLCTLPAVG